MGILSDLRVRLLPPSSRSFHELFSEVLWLHDNVRALRKETAALREEIASLRRGSFERLDTYDTHFKMMRWFVLARDGEIDVEVKLRSFQELPRAQGDFRLLQLSCGQLRLDSMGYCATRMAIILNCPLTSILIFITSRANCCRKLR